LCKAWARRKIGAGTSGGRFSCKPSTRKGELSRKENLPTGRVHIRKKKYSWIPEAIGKRLTQIQKAASASGRSPIGIPFLVEPEKMGGIA